MFDGVILVGLLVNGVYGSLLFGKGGVIYEYVIGMIIVMFVSVVEGYLKFWILGSDDLDLNVVKVNFGVFGFVFIVIL